MAGTLTGGRAAVATARLFYSAWPRPDRGKLEQVCHGLSRIVGEGDSSKRKSTTMMPDCVLIQVPSIDFRTFVGLTNKALGRSPAAPSDACRRHLSDAERFLSCLAAMRDEKAPAGFPPHLLRHVSFSALIGADERDMLEILQVASMPFVAVETIARGVQIAVVTGTLDQWRDAIISGCSKGVPTPVRHCFNKLHGLFTAAGLKVWPDYSSRPNPDQTYLLLEDKRGR